jgi:tRNA nucleotidyltransferase/poly(A) polymerase
VAGAPPAELAFERIPESVVAVLSRLADAGHEVAIVGGAIRDRLVGLAHEGDWDAATSAVPELVVAIFPGATWENRFGTVTVHGDPAVEVTSYRAEGAYRDRRRPDEVRFGVSLEDDLSRRDFTINAMAWVPQDMPAGRGRLVDPFGGRADLAARVLRTVGDPDERFAEDALRLIRAARFAGRLGLTLDPDTEAAIIRHAGSVALVSPERVRDELLRILALDERPSVALRLMERLGLLAVVLPELVALRGVPQQKTVPGDALDHAFATVDEAPMASPPDVRLAALLHDLGKATTLAGGHFIGHDRVGADVADGVLRRLRVPRATAARIVDAIRHHMYDYDSTWTDAAVRRFIRRTAGTDRELLFALRRADNAASGVANAGELNQAELEARIAQELGGQPDLLLHRRLAVDGHDLQVALGLPPGPDIGRVLDRLAEEVLDDPSRNERDWLLSRARSHLAER